LELSLELEWTKELEWTSTYWRTMKDGWYVDRKHFFIVFLSRSLTMVISYVLTIPHVCGDKCIWKVLTCMVQATLTQRLNLKQCNQIVSSVKIIKLQA
jgi:hypothetical protein